MEENNKKVTNSYLQKWINSLDAKELRWAIGIYSVGLVFITSIVMLLIYSWAEMPKVVEVLGLIGTFSSLFLALAAMIYAFMQAGSQEKNSEKINNSVFSLIQTSETISRKSAELAEATSEISEISSKLNAKMDKIAVNIEHQTSKVNLLTKKFDLGNNSIKLDGNNIEFKLEKISAHFFITIWALSLVQDKENVTIHQLSSVITQALLENLQEPLESELEVKYQHYYLGILRIFSDLGIISREGEIILYINVSQINAIISETKGEFNNGTASGEKHLNIISTLEILVDELI